MDERKRFRAVGGEAHVRDWTGKAPL